MTAPLPSSKFQLVSYSRSVTSSITGPMEKIFGLVEVAPSSIDRAGWHGRRMATIWWFLNKFLPLLTFLLPGSIVSWLMAEAMTSTNQTSRSSLRVGGAHSMALFLVLDENSSASCLSARGVSTWLKMVVGGGWWPPSGSSISRPFIMSSQVIFTNSWMACLNSLTLKDGSQDSLADYTSLPSFGGIDNKLL